MSSRILLNSSWFAMTAVSLGLLVGCNLAPEQKAPQFQKWDGLHVLSAVPVKKVDGEYVPVCRSTTEEPAGLQLNALFQGTMMTGESGDRDISIKPLALLGNQTVDPAKVTANLFELYFSCIESFPDDDLSQCSSIFTGGDDMMIDRVDFYNYGQPEETSQERVAVAVLMDMSGSMNGLVASHYPFQEGPIETLSQLMMFDSWPATDPKNARYVALVSFIKTLNHDDALILFAFNDYGIDVVCEIDGKAGADKATKLEECFTTDRDLVLGRASEETKSALESLQGEEKGMTPLWSAIEEVYPYMQGRTEEAKTAGVNDYKLRHLLVIGDGPDTCAASPEQNQCYGGCVAFSTTYDTLREMIEVDPMADRIPIHFVQMAAKGYPERDPRQQEISCLTGGHYSFVNTFDIPDGRLPDVLSQTINRIRYTFRGYWRLAVPMGTIKKANNPPRGWLYGVTGGGKVLPGAEGMLVQNEDAFSFKVLDEAAGDYDQADRRIAFRKECDPDGPSVCPASETFNECSSREWWCEPQTLTCMSAEAWVPNGEKSSCSPQDVYVSVRTTNAVDGEVGIELYALKGVETRCCMGGCMPPSPPAVPPEVATPAGHASACFWYEENKNWVFMNPDRVDLDDDAAMAWVYFAQLNIKEGCAVEDFAPYLSQYESTDFEPGDWSHCTKEVNCFQPPEF